MSKFNDLYMLGANELAAYTKDFGPQQIAAGFKMEDWNLLVQDECWTKEEQLKFASILSNACSMTLRVAGLAPVPLPAAYVAATICKLCAPCNRLVAAQSAPRAFDSRSALGFDGASEERPVGAAQMMALVEYFSAKDFAALAAFPVSEVVAAAVAAQQDLIDAQ